MTFDYFEELAKKAVVSIISFQCDPNLEIIHYRFLGAAEGNIAFGEVSESRRVMLELELTVGKNTQRVSIGFQDKLVQAVGFQLNLLFSDVLDRRSPPEWAKTVASGSFILWFPGF